MTVIWEKKKKNEKKKEEEVTEGKGRSILGSRSVGGCLGGFRVLRALLVSVQPLSTGFEVRRRVFRWFSGLTGLGPTTVDIS